MIHCSISQASIVSILALPFEQWLILLYDTTCSNIVPWYRPYSIITLYIYVLATITDRLICVFIENNTLKNDEAGDTETYTFVWPSY